MPKVDALLINPISARSIPAFVPHGLLYIASFAIKSGYTIAIYDRNVEDATIEQVLRDLKPRIVGLGCLTGSSIDDAIYISKQAKAFDASIKVVWGGVHTTLYPDSVLRESYVDFVVIGDGEKAFSEILDAILRNGKPLELVDNIGYKDKNQFKYTRRLFINLDELPQPAWHLIKVEKYIRKKFYANRVITINTSRGCPYKCSFCCVPKVHIGKWRGLSAEKIIENLTYLKERYKIDGFQVDDDEFDIDKSRVLKLCELLQFFRLNLKWSHFSRINIAQEEVLKKEIRQGLRLIEFGIESGSARMLKFLNKGQTIEQITAAYNICRRLKVKTSALFMIGLPTEGMDDLRATLKLVKCLNPYITIATIYRPYPGTELFNYCVNKGLFRYADDLSKIGQAYSRTINISPLPDKLLLRIKRHFDMNNIYQEMKFILTRMKLGLLFYYFFYYVLKPKERWKNAAKG